MSVFVLGGLRWLQSVWVVQLLVAATPLTLWLRVLSYDDHPVLNLVAQEHEKDSKLSSSLPHRCACCAKVLCATLHSVVVHDKSLIFPSACSCASTSCRSSSHCVSWLSRDCSGISTGSHIFDSAWRLSSQRCISTAQQYQPICTPRRSSSLQSNICNTSCSVLATAAKSFNSLDKLRAITPDALLTETFAPKPETACNSLSLPPPRGQKEIDRRSAVLLTDT